MMNNSLVHQKGNGKGKKRNKTIINNKQTEQTRRNGRGKKANKTITKNLTQTKRKWERKKIKFKTTIIKKNQKQSITRAARDTWTPLDRLHFLVKAGLCLMAM